MITLWDMATATVTAHQLTVNDGLMTPVLSANVYSIGGDEKFLDCREHAHLDGCDKPHFSQRENSVHIFTG